jgi:hypothetical protein
MVKKVEESCSNPAPKSEFELNGLAGHLDVATHKLEVVLQQKYDHLCLIDPEGSPGYTTDYNGALDTWGDRINVAKIRLLSLAPTVTSTTPTVAPTQPQRTAHMEYRHLPRLDTLSFSGGVEDWPEFRRDWLARYGNLREDVQIQYLKPALPQKDHAKIAAVTTMTECWTRLEKTYGDRTLNIVTVKNNLRSCQPKGAQRWEKVSDLHEQIKKAVM